jgi:hypothetical protein
VPRDPESPEGYIYALVNGAYVGLVKIGKTHKTVEERAREIRKEGVPYPFVVVASRLVSDRHAAERAVHDLLERASRDRRSRVLSR